MIIETIPIISFVFLIVRVDILQVVTIDIV